MSAKPKKKSAKPTRNLVRPTKTKVSLLDMSRLGIQAAVYAEQSELDELRGMFSTHPDESFMQGKGKLGMRVHLKNLLEKLDVYFNDNPAKMIASNPVWSDFCTDCAIYSVLCSVMDDTPVGLIHPEDHAAANPTWVHAEGNGDIKPDLIEGIPREQ